MGCYFCLMNISSMGPLTNTKGLAPPLEFFYDLLDFSILDFENMRKLRFQEIGSI